MRRGPEFPELDPLICDRVRLGIVSALATNKSLSFNDSKRLKTTGRNLIVHARKLEDARYITSNKFFDGRISRTNFRLTASGRKALDSYLSEMEVVIRYTREDQKHR